MSRTGGSRGVMVAVLLSAALLSGSWLMGRGAGAHSRDLAASTHLFQQVAERVQSDYVEPISDTMLYRHAIDGALRELHDPHTVFLDARRLDRLDESTSGHYAGVGIQMDVRDSGITVVTTLPGTPAQQAGILTGDRIVKIDGRSTFGLTADEALRSLRGEAGTSVRVEIARSTTEAAIPFTIVRRVISVNPVQHAVVLADSIGYVDLTIFSADAARDLAAAVDSLRRAGARSLMLDLRSNPGGLLDQGVGVADLFLDAGQQIVVTKGRMSAENQRFADRAAQRWPAMPIVVLTDSSSASASEIVAGALQDHDRAVVIGTATYGKGSAQRVIPVEDGALKLTTALWYTPSGRSINHPHPTGADDAEDPAPVPDSTPRPRFRTDAGRVVVGGGGIVPDIVIARLAASASERALQVALGEKVPVFRDAVTEYALALKRAGAVRDPAFSVTPAMRMELRRRLVARKVIIAPAVYDSAAAVLDRVLGTQIARYTFGPGVEFSRSMREDPVVARAAALLSGVTTPQQLLTRARSTP